MFFVTGDTHADIDIRKLNTENFSVQRELTRDDYVIICGDFGFVWDGSKRDKWWQEWLDSRSFTTLFVDGNHENHDLLAEYPVSEWNGGKVHFIRPNVIHLMRGQVFDIDGVRFFTMGGAASHDKEYRKEGESWWAGEMPSAEEYAEAERNLERVGWKVDYVITHDAPTSVQAYLGAGRYIADELNGFFEGLLGKLEFEQWFFGHYHQDVPMPAQDKGLRGKDKVVVSTNSLEFVDGSDSGCGRRDVESGCGITEARKEFRGIYRDVVLVEKEKVFLKDTRENAVVPSARVFYHVTLAENVESIQKNGLIPQIGLRSAEVSESEPAVFLFPYRGDAEDSLGCWLGKWYEEHYDENWEPVIIEVRLPDDIPVYETGTDFERVCMVTIPPEYLSFFDDKWNKIGENVTETVDAKIERAMDVLDVIGKYEGFREEIER